MKTTIDTFFLISGFECSPDEITDRLKLQPTKTWERGDAISITTRKYDFNGWQLKSPLSQDTYPEQHVEWFLEKLPLTFDCLKKIKGKLETEISISIFVEDEIPPLCFASSIVKRLARLNAGIDIDIYGINE